MLGENIKTVTQYFGYTLCHCLAIEGKRSQSGLPPWAEPWYGGTVKNFGIVLTLHSF